MTSSKRIALLGGCIWRYEMAEMIRNILRRISSMLHLPSINLIVYFASYIFILDIFEVVCDILTEIIPL